MQGSSARAGLDVFVQRAKVVVMYREALRVARQAGDDARKDLTAEIKREFNTTRDVKDVSKIKFLLQDGRTRVEHLRTMLGLSRP